MRYGVKILRDIGIYYLKLSISKVIAHVIHCLMGVFFRSESVRVFLKSSVKYRFNYYLYRHLHYPVFDCRYPQRSFAAIGFRNINPPHRHGLVGLAFQFLDYALKIPLPPTFPLLYALKGYPVYSGGTFVRPDKSVGIVQDIHPVRLVIEKIESVLLLLLGLLV